MFQEFLKQHSFSEYEFKSDVFPSVNDRAFWNAFANDECVHLAEAALDYGWPIIKATDFMAFKKNGDRMIMEDIHFDRREHLLLFALAELKENKGRFLPQIVNGLFTTCEETFWGLSAHWPNLQLAVEHIHRVDDPYVDLFASETAEHVAMIATLLREPLTRYCPEILDRIDYELEKRIKTPYLSHRDWHWMGYHRAANNWTPWVLSNLLTVFLLTEKNERRLHRALTKMFVEIQFYYDGLPADGGCNEGTTYWEHAGGTLFQFLYQLKQATNGQLDLFGDEKLGLAASYMKKAHMVSDLFVNVADSHAFGHSSSMPILFGFARETAQEDLMNFSAAVYQEKGDSTALLSHRVRNLRRVVYHAEFIREMMDYKVSLPLHGALEQLPDMQLAVLRAGDWILSAKGGHNAEHHNHNDVGSFSLYNKTTPVLVDVGINTYSGLTFQNQTRYTVIPWTQSPYHNLPTVNGIGQRNGGKFRADRFEANEEKIEISFHAAYPPEAGLLQLTRTLSYTDTSVSCTDCFAFTDQKAKAVTEVLMSVLPVRIENGAAILGERYRISVVCGTVETEFVPFEDRLLEKDWNIDGVTRILFHVENASAITLTVEKI